MSKKRTVDKSARDPKIFISGSSIYGPPWSSLPHFIDDTTQERVTKMVDWQAKGNKAKRPWPAALASIRTSLFISTNGFGSNKIGALAHLLPILLPPPPSSSPPRDDRRSSSMPAASPAPPSSRIDIDEWMGRARSVKKLKPTFT
jgi:hypothetical protein